MLFLTQIRHVARLSIHHWRLVILAVVIGLLLNTVIVLWSIQHAIRIQQLSVLPAGLSQWSYDARRGILWKQFDGIVTTVMVLNSDGISFSGDTGPYTWFPESRAGLPKRAYLAGNTMSSEWYLLIESFYGWPMICISGCELCDKSQQPMTINAQGVTIHKESFLIPLRIHWPGIFCNLILSAVSIISVVQLLRYIARLRRHARGACSHCGYCLRANVDVGCPECGWRRDQRSVRI